MDVYSTVSRICSVEYPYDGEAHVVFSRCMYAAPAMGNAAGCR